MQRQERFMTEWIIDQMDNQTYCNYKFDRNYGHLRGNSRLKLAAPCLEIAKMVERSSLLCTSWGSSITNDWKWIIIKIKLTWKILVHLPPDSGVNYINVWLDWKVMRYGSLEGKLRICQNWSCMVLISSMLIETIVLFIHSCSMTNKKIVSIIW